MLGKLFKRSPDFSDIDVTFISRDECHLCDVAFDVLEGMRRKYRFRLNVIKIQEGTELYDRYWDKIPVGLIAGRMAFKYRVDPEDFLRKLEATVE
jgi:hypothetical protein